MKIKLDCKEMSRLFSQGLDETLPSAECARMRLHLVICDACRNVDEQMQFLRQAMRELGQRQDPPDP